MENNKPDVIETLTRIADNPERDPDDNVRVLPLRARYPQGAEKVLVKSCTNRVIPLGKLPADVGCIVMNITSVAFVADYLKTGMPLVKKARHGGRLRNSAPAERAGSRWDKDFRPRGLLRRAGKRSPPSC